MKALTVQQPWAWAIVHGGKDVENRVQAWSYRGPLAIHAGARWSDRGAGSQPVANAVDRALATGQSPGDQPRDWTVRALIGVVDLVAVHVAARTATGTCCSSAWAEYAEGPTKPVVHLVLEDPRPLAEPIPAKGRLGLWTPDVELLDRIREQVPA